MSAVSSNPPVVSVVMVSYFTGRRLIPALQSVLSQNVELELILVDNGNPEAVRHELASLARRDGRVRLIGGHGNIGFARASNLGAAAAQGRYLFLLNPDTELMPGALSALMREGDTRPRPWLVGPKLVNEDGSEQRGARRAVLTPWRAVVEGAGLYRLLPRHPAFQRFNLNETPCSDHAVEMPVISGAAMFLPTEDFRRLAGFDERYFLHVEDIDFCYRFLENGGRTYFVPGAVVKHHQGSSRASAAFVEWHKARGFLIYFWTHFGSARRVVPLALLSAAILAAFAFRAGVAGLRRLARGR